MVFEVTATIVVWFLIYVVCTEVEDHRKESRRND